VGDALNSLSWLPEVLSSFVKEFVTLLPTLVLTILNSIQVPVIKKVIALEKWDYQYQRVQQGIWRIWIGKILNLTIFVLV